MSTKPDGGPAFPGAMGIGQNEGMSLRDWFAGMALSGLATNQEMLLANDELVTRMGTAGIDRLQANKAYRLADAMLTERNKP